MAKVKAAIGRCEKWITFENTFKAVVLLMVWGLLSFPVALYYASKEKSTSSNWLETISQLLQTLEGNCDAGLASDFNGTSNGSLGQDCSDIDSQVSALHVGYSGGNGLKYRAYKVSSRIVGYPS